MRPVVSFAIAAAIVAGISLIYFIGTHRDDLRSAWSALSESAPKAPVRNDSATATAPTAAELEAARRRGVEAEQNAECAVGMAKLADTGECLPIAELMPEPADDPGNYARGVRWNARPQREDFARYAPSTAEQDARVRLNCLIGQDGALSCSVHAVETTGDPDGFGEASLRVARHFRAAPTLDDGSPSAGRMYRLNIAWRMSEIREADPRRPATREEVRERERAIHDNATCEAEDGVWNAFERRCYLPNRN